jgi:hypothetical protein
MLTSRPAEPGGVLKAKPEGRSVLKAAAGSVLTC